MGVDNQSFAGERESAVKANHQTENVWDFTPRSDGGA
jgi:hypothetical protein